MNILLILIVIAFSFTGVVMVMIGLPGTFIVWTGVLISALINGFRYISIKLLIVLFSFTILGEVLEYLSGLAGARKYGASTKGVMGALFGGMIGAVMLTALFPGLGTIIGALAGTFAGAFIGEYTSGSDLITSSRAGFGAFLGRVAAIGIKVLIILAISSIAISRYFYQ
ncbi:DUF456 domain-containing protein [Elusimicrobiota bacterium]